MPASVVACEDRTPTLMERPAPLAVSASSMRAAVTTRYGLPEVVEVREVPTPTPADNEVLVRVRASSVCHKDWQCRGADRRSDRASSGPSGAHSSRLAQLAVAVVPGMRDGRPQRSRRSSTSDTMNPKPGQPPDWIDRSNHLRACALSPRRRYQLPRP